VRLRQPGCCWRCYRLYTCCLQVNKIREVPHHESVLVTHTDSAEVYVWSLERQPNRASDKVGFAHAHGLQCWYAAIFMIA